MGKARLFIDVDDTIIAACHLGSGFDLRPGVLTQLRVLSRLYNCMWLTMWKKNDIRKLVKSLYGSGINAKMRYADWRHEHPERKCGYVIGKGKTKNFWWLEDPLCQEEMEALNKAGLTDRYIRVEPHGQWAFLDAVNELFKRSGVDDAAIRAVGGKPEWFQKDAIIASAPGHSETLLETLSMVKLIASAGTTDAETKLKEIQTYVQNQLDTIY